MKQLAFSARSTRSTTLTAFAVALLIGGSLMGCSSDEEDAAPGQATPATNAQAGDRPTATIETVYISADYVSWVANTQELVKNVDNVFIGTVLSAGETFSLYGPEHGDVWTPYTVEVEQRLLGSVEGTITVVQQGGFDPDRKILVIVEEDPLIEVGETYMLASLSNRNDDRPEWDGLHFVAAVKGHVRIKDEAHRQQLIQEYTEAINKAGLGS